MTLRLYDTASREVREFRPVIPGKASVYLCGAAVGGMPHIGHLRSAVSFDILVRWLEASGYQVTYCRNVTDLSDAILAAAATGGTPWWALAERNKRAFAVAYDLLGCRPPDAEPQGSGHVPAMIALVTRLVDGGHGYHRDGEVYFDAGSAPGYGTLSCRPAGTREHRDFALWRRSAPGEPSWDSPWGTGRPGRHLECAAISAGYLGTVFDIHGGGADLVFPHHENERALALAAGDESARHWVHHGLVSLSGRKMSNSAGHVIAVAEALNRVRPQELRYYLCHTHYRSALDYSPDGLDEAAAAYQRIERFVNHARHAVGTSAAVTARVPISFADVMDGDLGVPAALAAVHAAVRDGNYALSTGNLEGARACLAQVRAMLAVLGLDPLADTWQSSDPGERLRVVVDALVALALRQREAARTRADYACADSIREALERTGVVVEDTPEGPRWELAR